MTSLEFGSHVSASGGVDLAIPRATELAMTACQIFTKNERQWNAKPLDPAVIERWRRVASITLWRLSGRRYGPSCPVTVRPCGRSCAEEMVSWATLGPSTGGWVPYLGADGQWRNAAVCGCRSSCSCTQLCEVRLDGPVYDVVEVLVDGEALVPEAYRVDVPNLLVRLDGECWPACQDMAAPCGHCG